MSCELSSEISENSLSPSLDISDMMKSGNTRQFERFCLKRGEETNLATDSEPR